MGSVAVDWRRIGRLAGAVALIVVFVANLLADIAKLEQVANIGLVNAINTVGFDWSVMSQASRVVFNGGDPYYGTAFVWTPIAALAFYPVSLMGWHLWQLAHIAGALAMPTWRVRLIVLLAYPFWWDVELGNGLIFVLLAAAWALRGSKVAIAAFLVLTVLVPRPLMAPIAVGLLWKHKHWQLPFVAMVSFSIAATAAMGLLGPFVARSLEAGVAIQHGSNFAPSHLIGPVWLLIALPLASLLTWRGRLGLASVFASPYWLPNYLLFAVVDADNRPEKGTLPDEVPSATRRTRTPRSVGRRQPDPVAS